MGDQRAKEPPDKLIDWAEDDGMAVVDSDEEKTLAQVQMELKSGEHTNNSLNGSQVSQTTSKTTKKVDILENILLNKNANDKSPALFDSTNNKSLTKDNNSFQCSDAAEQTKNSSDSEGIRKNVSNMSENRSESPFYDFNNRYKSTDRGPYYVYVEHENKNLGRLFPVRIGHYLFNDSTFRNNVVDIKAIGINRVKVIFKSYYLANQLVTSQVIKNNKLVAYIPRFFTQKKGVIRMVDTYFSESFLKSAIQSDVEVIDVKRMNRKTVGPDGETVMIPRQIIIVTFLGSRLPSEVKISLVNFPVEPYIHPVVQCFSCLRFGHTSKMCKGTARCKKCGGNHRMIDCDSEETSCIFCNSKDHLAISKNCPEYNKQFSIKKTMATENISFKEAEKIVNNPSYAKITTNNRFAPLSDLESFPFLPKSQYTRDKVDNSTLTAPVVRRPFTQPTQIKKRKSVSSPDRSVPTNSEKKKNVSFSQSILPNPHREDFIAHKENLIEKISILFITMIKTIIPEQSDENLYSEFKIKEHISSIFGNLFAQSSDASKRN